MAIPVLQRPLPYPRRPRRRRATPPAPARVRSVPFVGRDVSVVPAARRALAPWLAPLALGLVLGLVLLAGLRSALIDVRYDLAEAQQVRQELVRQEQRWRLAARRLRHPARLVPLAGSLGLGPVPRVELPGAGSDTP